MYVEEVIIVISKISYNIKTIEIHVPTVARGTRKEIEAALKGKARTQ